MDFSLQNNIRCLIALFLLSIVGKSLQPEGEIFELAFYSVKFLPRKLHPMLSRNCSSLPLHKLCLAHLYAVLKVVQMLIYVKKSSSIMSPASNS